MVDDSNSLRATVLRNSDRSWQCNWCRTVHIHAILSEQLPGAPLTDSNEEYFLTSRLQLDRAHTIDWMRGS